MIVNLNSVSIPQTINDENSIKNFSLKLEFMHKKNWEGLIYLDKIRDK